MQDPVVFINPVRGLAWVSRVAIASLFVMAHVAHADDPPPGIVLNEHGHGWVLTDDKGMSLYTTVRDQQPGKSACNAACAQLWPPVLAGAQVSGSGDWSLVDRDDGSVQWAFQGQPLYRYSFDVNPGDSYGSGLEGEWEAATKLIDCPVTVSVARTLLGYVLTDARSGTALYHFRGEKPGKPACTGGCVRTWTPLSAALMATADGDWSIVQRSDGIRQWAYKDRPLYLFAGDLAPGEANGHGKDGAKWQAAILESLPPLPGWVTVQGSDAGQILADSEGKTLYGRAQSRIRNPNLGLAESQSVRPGYEEVGSGRTTNCVECPRSYWQPVFANQGAQPLGNWSLVEREDGRTQWAYKGEPLYTHGRDKFPGALNGVRSGDRSWHALMRSGQQMQGTGN